MKPVDQQGDQVGPRAQGVRQRGPLSRGLSRLADLHAELAQVFRDLAEHPKIDLAAGPTLRLMGGTGDEQPNPSKMQIQARLLTANDLAERIQVDAKTVHRWRTEGRLPEPIEIGGVVRWRPEAIDDWLDGGAA